MGPLRDGSPKRTVDEATDSSKNEKHGDGGRTLEKEKERLEGLESDVKNATNAKNKNITINFISCFERSSIIHLYLLHMYHSQI